MSCHLARSPPSGRHDHACVTAHSCEWVLAACLRAQRCAASQRKNPCFQRFTRPKCARGVKACTTDMTIFPLRCESRSGVGKSAKQAGQRCHDRPILPPLCTLMTSGIAQGHGWRLSPHDCPECGREFAGVFFHPLRFTSLETVMQEKKSTKWSTFTASALSTAVGAALS